jgi:ABC-type transport system involved in multi-copper enzyme maturation permease subunit
MTATAPTTTVATGRPRPALLAIISYTLRSCIPPRRWAALLAACVFAVLFGLLAHAIDRSREWAFAMVAAEGILSLAIPIAALVVGDAILGAEVRGGTFHFTWLSPTPTWQIVIGRWIGGCIVAVTAVAASVALAALVADAPSVIGPIVLAASVETVSYLAIFIAIGCLTRRTAVWSLAFVFLVERLLGAALTGIAQLSPQWESRGVFIGLIDVVPVRLERDGIPVGWAAVVRLAVVTAVVLAIAVWRMRHLRLAGAAD